MLCDTKSCDGQTKPFCVATSILVDLFQDVAELVGGEVFDRAAHELIVHCIFKTVEPTLVCERVSQEADIQGTLWLQCSAILESGIKAGMPDGRMINAGVI